MQFLSVDEMSLVLNEHPFEWSALAGLVGACMASFVGVVATRLPHSAGWRPLPTPGVNLMQPSRCDACGQLLSPLALVPVLGWVAKRGKCTCGAKVPVVYPASELATGLASAAVAGLLGPTEECLWALVLIWTCLAIAWIDIREGWIPARLTAPMTMLGLITSPFAPDALSRSVGLALCVGAVALSGAIVSAMREGKVSVGGGDLELAAAAGAWLGQPSVPAFLLLASVLQVLTHLIARRLPQGRWEPVDAGIRSEIGDSNYAPMGPAICIAFLICLLSGGHLALG